ncbi:cytochrome c553 [Natronocella acetinitrilica]|uniref:Cytochrome c553 n=1 Tax=Natronocella acetinitrilica TaxID=414046 RepID=A0AAE3G5V8_9GAMM|nr:cytochrome C [Natronocella acetinitrilica]MCP1675281.1 cytochrome c553 [Natronocella acetinitrilica]
MVRPGKSLLAASAAALLLLTASHVHAEDGISYNHAALLASSCFACHGTDGRMDEGITPIAGRSYDSLRAVLMAFRDDNVPNTTVMNRITAGYTDEELEAIALYFSGLSAESGGSR